MIHQILEPHNLKGATSTFDHASPVTISYPSGVTLLSEHSPSWVSEIDYFDIFSHPRENHIAQFFKKFNLLIFFLIS